MKEAYPIMLGVLFCAVLVWFFLCYQLFRILETRHPTKYEAMGKPSLIMNNSISNNIRFLRFLFRREWQGLGDSGLESLSKFMLGFFTAYLVLFVLLVASVALGHAP